MPTWKPLIWKEKGANLFHSLYPAFVITRREVRDQFRDWRIIFPIVGLTLFFPFLMNFTATRILNFVEQYGASIVGERLVPFLMMIVGFFPISVSLVIALESFVGEKERGSIEPLLNTPLKDWQLYVGKLLSSIAPPLVGSFLGMSVYTLGLVINHVPLPEFRLIFLIIVLTIVQAIVMVSGAIVVSSQATSVRAANLLASFIIIPMALLIQGESIVMFWGNYGTLWWAVFGLSVLSILLVRVGLAHFQREELLGKEIDVLNIKWGWHVFRRGFIGKSTSIRDWYRSIIHGSLHRIRWSFLIVLVLVIAGIWIGTLQVSKFKFPLDSSGLDHMDNQLKMLIAQWPIGHLGPVLLIFWQNLRVMLLALVLGLFSFGIMGVLPLMASVGIAGYLMNLLNLSGLQVGVYLIGFILPHGIIEIPAAMLATAAVLQAGVILAAPDAEKTVGEVWILAFADWAKIMVGLVIPMLLLAAFIEAWLTPRLAVWLFFS
jgi:uncharacterized membrane protein SpoIIM required for sporulation/ABC-type transport system involved in multi-copper enzyme maturation permease subunit